jgi:hypothetical protein
MQPLSVVPRHTAIIISARIRFIRASLVSCELTIFGAQITGVFVCNETCVLKHVALRTSPFSCLSHEIFGFRTHKSTVNNAVIRHVEQVNGRQPSFN